MKTAEDWNDPEKPKLWLYHLHYFDDLNARAPGERGRLHLGLIRRWIEDNPPGEGVGWEPYPTSLRIVNWMKWSLREGGDELPDSAIHSLAVQARWLEHRLEHHLLGNHLLANAKALTFAGLFFDGPEAARWYRRGREILEREIEEQILEDGGHFERSPMYHAMVFEDVLDLINLFRCYGLEVPAEWRRTASSMKEWLDVMRHPDAEIPFFNDAALGMALTPVQLDEYLERLEVSTDRQQSVRRPVHNLPATGYTRVEVGPAVAFLDLAPVGPDYLPAHAHADTLSFELSLGGRRLFVNSGTSTYEHGDRREWERGTQAHNTLAVDGENSSEVWAAFRVARRAQVLNCKIERTDGTVCVTGEHDGYTRLKGRPVHHREWCFERESFKIVDRIEGEGEHSVDLCLHVHPAWEIRREAEEDVHLTTPGEPGQCRVRFEGPGRLLIESSYYAPEFGRLEPTQRLRYRIGSCEPPVEIHTHVTWRDARRDAEA